MPPRKRARVSQASTPQPKPSAEAASPEAQIERSNVLTDPWTDEEESQLFKSVIKYKPTGASKHFRMVSIQLAMASHGFTAPNLEHTKIPGIWSKLDSLYDLEVLDEREREREGIHATPSDSEQSDQEEEDEEEEGEDEAENPWRRRDFDLQGDEFGELAFTRRLDPERPSSPEAVEGLSRTRNILGEDELREKREEYDKEDASSVRGKGRKAAAARATRAKGGRSTRSTPAEPEEEDDEGDEDEGSTVEGSPQGKGAKKPSSRAASTRRSRRR